MNAEKKITQARVAMLFSHPFFGYLAISLETEEKKNMSVPTMATDGKKLYYDPEWVQSISLQELMGVIAHEIGHIILHHIARRQSREVLRWNVATDYADNALILKEFKLPQGALYNRDFEEKSAEWIYTQLPETKVTAVCIDSHDEWSGWGNGDDGDDSQKQGSADTGAAVKEGLSSDDLEQQWRERIAQAATLARMAGKFPGHLQTVVNGILQPKPNWKTILQDLIVSSAKSNFRLVPPHKKHLWRGFYLPSVTGEELNIAVAVDSSSSISDDEIKEFLAEVKGICDSFENYTIYLFICDTKIQQRYELHNYDPLPKVVSGRGGTSFKEPFEEAKKLDISSLVYLTDLCPNDGFPEQPEFPVIWVAITDVTPPYGWKIQLRG
jgi:predicted metal-dependent peptidase